MIFHVTTGKESFGIGLVLGGHHVVRTGNAQALFAEVMARPIEELMDRDIDPVDG